MNGFASPPTEVCRESHRLKPRDTHFTLQSRNESYKNSTIYNDIYEILGDISTSVPYLKFSGGPSPAALPLSLLQWTRNRLEGVESSLPLSQLGSLVERCKLLHDVKHRNDCKRF